MRLTNHLNLPAPGRRQTLYVHLTCLQSPVFLLNSRYRHLSATQSSFGGEPLHRAGPPFFRSYGSRLQSSLTRVLSSALGFSPRPPESVCGTDTSLAPRGAFLGSVGSRTSGHTATSSPLGVGWPHLLIVWDPPTGLNRHFRPAAALPFSVPPRFDANGVVQEY